MDLGHVFVGLIIFGICYGIREVVLYFMDKHASHKILANWSRYKMLAKEKTLNLDVCVLTESVRVLLSYLLMAIQKHIKCVPMKY